MENTRVNVSKLGSVRTEDGCPLGEDAEFAS